MEGWRSVAELTRWGFAHAPVVMANEAHDLLARSVRTRESGISIIEAAHAAPPLDACTGVDAVVVSTDNTLA